MDTDLNPCSPEDLVIRNNFKKDFKFSCPVLDDEDIFQKSLKIAKLENEYEDYYELAYNHPDLENFRRNLIGEIVKKVKEQPSYSKIKNIETPYHLYPTSHTYLKPEVVGKNLISVDLVEGNFQSLKYYGDDLVLGKDNYTDFIKTFTKEQTLVKSKYFRQQIFGLLEPRTFISVQRHMIAHMLNDLFKKKKYTIVNLTNDEVILESGASPSDVEADKKLIQEICDNLPYRYRVDDFSIEKVSNSRNEPWYIKYSEVQGRRIMGVHVKYLFQVYNHIEKIPNQKKDFYWRERGRLCCLLDHEEFETQDKAKSQESS